MNLLTKNADLLPSRKLSAWRKIAIGTWKTTGDPSVYGILELNAEPALQYLKSLGQNDLKNSDAQENPSKRFTMTHYIARAVGIAIGANPSINCVLRFGRIYPRKSVDLFFQVATDNSGTDLSGIKLTNVDKKSVLQISAEMEAAIHKVRKAKDPVFQKVKQIMGLSPGWFTKYLLDFNHFIMVKLNLWSSLLGSPRDPFGSAMVTNIGSLGLDIAFAPLVPYSGCPLLIAVGKVQKLPTVVDGKVVAQDRIRLCCTFDHRFIDGVHAGHMAKKLQEVFENPRLLDTLE